VEYSEADKYAHQDIEDCVQDAHLDPMDEAPTCPEGISLYGDEEVFQ
jgi:hypothetical protein